MYKLGLALEEIYTVCCKTGYKQGMRNLQCVWYLQHTAHTEQDKCWNLIIKSL